MRLSTEAEPTAILLVSSNSGEVGQLEATSLQQMVLPGGPFQVAEHALDAAGEPETRADASFGGQIIADSLGHESGQIGDQLMRLCFSIFLQVQAKAALLVHGALVESRGCGVILAGPGGAGKTTASKRLPPPWQTLSDDAVLIVHHPQEGYWAHPWPTLSEFVRGDARSRRHVQAAIPLRGIFFLVQDDADRAVPLGQGEAVCMLLESAEQASWEMTLDWQMQDIRRLRLLGLENACALACAIPTYRLHLSLNGRFWSAMEQELSGLQIGLPRAI